MLWEEVGTEHTLNYKENRHLLYNGTCQSRKKPPTTTKVLTVIMRTAGCLPSTWSLPSALPYSLSRNNFSLILFFSFLNNLTYISSFTTRKKLFLVRLSHKYMHKHIHILLQSFCGKYVVYFLQKNYRSICSLLPLLAFSLNVQE